MTKLIVPASTGTSATAATIAAAACSSSPNAGPLGEGMAGALKIVAVDTSRPPRSVAVELDEPWLHLLRPDVTATDYVPALLERGRERAAVEAALAAIARLVRS